MGTPCIKSDVVLTALLQRHVDRWREKSLTSPAHACLLASMIAFAESAVLDFPGDEEFEKAAAEQLAEMYYHHHGVEGQC